jgi:hypothetical protein
VLPWTKPGKVLADASIELAGKQIFFLGKIIRDGPIRRMIRDVDSWHDKYVVKRDAQGTKRSVVEERRSQEPRGDDKDLVARDFVGLIR